MVCCAQGYLTSNRCFIQASVAAGTTAISIAVHKEKPTPYCASIHFLKQALINKRYKKKPLDEQLYADLKKMLTCSLSFLCASNSLCNLSALSSAASVFSCKTLIFRLTASSDVTPAIVPATVGFKNESRCAISDRLSCDELTSSVVRSWKRAERMPALCPGSTPYFEIFIMLRGILVVPKI